MAAFPVESPVDSVSSRFTVEQVLGRGASATVYEASFRDDPARRLAIKTLKLKTLFEKEVGILSDINHVNIIHMVLEPEQIGDTGYIYLDLHQKETMSTLRGCFDAMDIWNINLEVSSALQYLHQQRIYHRDVKPSNILRGFKGEAILADFGLAERLPTTTDTVDHWKTTPGFEGPEAWDFEPMCPFKLDMFSYGVTLVVMIFGNYPDPGENVMEMSDHCSAVQEPIRRIIFHLLHEDPDQRWSATQLVLDCLQNGYEAVSHFESNPSPLS